MNIATWKKLFLYALFFLVVIILVVGAGYLNYYLKTNNYLFYATGTNEKAFINSTWEMSVDEVVRANNAELIKGGALTCLLGIIEFDSIEHRILCYEDDDASLFGNKAEVIYFFFDNRLFEFNLSIPVYGYADVSKLLKQLEHRFGEGYSQDAGVNPSYEHAQNYEREWTTDKEKVKFNLFFPSKNQLQDEDYSFEGTEVSGSPRVFLNVIYLPMVKKIEDENEIEESSYF